MAIKSDREFDIIIFGASGYTGMYVVEELAKVNKDLDKKWAVAGRNREKVSTSLKAVQQYLNDVEITNIPIIKADVADLNSINEMCKRTKLLLNCVGPYNLYGENVVAACVEHGTHHVDLSGERKYLTESQVKHFEQAREKGIYIVQSCGFDSIPNDVGIALLKDKFPGDLNSVESYIEFFEGPEGRVTNIGTWMSAVHSVRDGLKARYYRNLLNRIFDRTAFRSSHSLKRRCPLFYSDVVGGWCIRFVGADENVVERSQMFGYQHLNERPTQVAAYLKMKSLCIGLCYMASIFVFGILSLCSAGRSLLEKYPSFFSAGLFTKDGPTRKQVEESSMKITLVGHGWAEKSDQHSHPPDVKKKLTVTGPDPAYVLASRCLVHSGLVILDEADKMPLNGGVLTPGAAFGKTSLPARLEKRGIFFNYEE